MQLKNYVVKIFPARLAQTFFLLNFCGFSSGAQVYFVYHCDVSCLVTDKNLIVLWRHLLVTDNYPWSVA